MTLGQYIRKLREQDKDLSLREFARKIDCSAAFVSDIELGRRYPSEKVLAKIAKVLAATVEDLRAHDTRIPVKEIKRLAGENPEYALAFRRLVNSKVSAEDLMKWAKKRSGRKDKK